MTAAGGLVAHSQGVYPLRRALAQVLAWQRKSIHVTHVEGPGCYGHNGADDAALDAALLARALPGRPVSLKWTRADEHAWEPYAPAMRFACRPAWMQDGEVIDWNHDVWSYPHRAVHARATTLAAGSLASCGILSTASHRRPDPRGAHTGEHRNADPLYEFPQRRIVQPFCARQPAAHLLAAFVGRLHQSFCASNRSWMSWHMPLGVDPLEFRLRYLKDARARRCWKPRQRNAGWAQRSRSGEGYGQGMAFAQYKNSASYSAVVVDLSVDRESGLIRLERAVIAADAGQVVNPDHLSSQLSGSFIQAASMTLMEQVRYDQYGITSLDWYSYPIMRFPDVPQIEVLLLDRPGAPYLGSGEAGPGRCPAAIANAIFDAVGVRLRHIPFLPDKVKAALG